MGKELSLYYFKVRQKSSSAQQVMSIVKMFCE